MHAEGRKGILISSSLINVRRESLVKTTRRFHNSALMLLSSLRLLSDGMQCSTTSWPLWTWIDIRTTTPSDAETFPMTSISTGLDFPSDLTLWSESRAKSIKYIPSIRRRQCRPKWSPQHDAKRSSPDSKSCKTLILNWLGWSSVAAAASMPIPSVHRAASSTHLRALPWTWISPSYHVYHTSYQCPSWSCLR